MADQKEIPIYDEAILDTFDWSAIDYFPDPRRPGDNLIVRPLYLSDYNRGFLQLLEQLTLVGDVSQEQFAKQFYAMRDSKAHYVSVVEDTSTGRIAAAATCAIEMKFIHECCLRSRLEDVVVDKAYRGRRLGLLLVDVVKLISKYTGAYKLSLDCKDENIAYYEKVGFKYIQGGSNMLVWDG